MDVPGAPVADVADGAPAFVVGADGWVQPTRHVPSPNFDARPDGVPVDLLVLHNISLPPGQFGSGDIEAFFQNRLDPGRHPFFATIHQVQVSAHFLIARNGEVVQFVSCLDRAWHAGQSDFLGRPRCNDFSIGVEIEGADDQPFEPAQYASAVALARALVAAYPIGSIAGHSDIAPGRKTDPGPFFDWDAFARGTGLPDARFPYRMLAAPHRH